MTNKEAVEMFCAVATPFAIIVFAVWRKYYAEKRCYLCNGTPGTTPSCRACVGLKIKRELYEPKR